MKVTKDTTTKTILLFGENYCKSHSFFVSPFVGSKLGLAVDISYYMYCALLALIINEIAAN